MLAIILFSSIFMFGKDDALRSGNISINSDIFDLTTDQKSLILNFLV